jgi:hypothetical protein
MTTIEKVGARLYLVGLPYAAKEEAKAALRMNGHNFDSERRQWFVGTAKKKAAEAFVARLNAGPLVPTASSRKAATQLGLDLETPACVVADAAADAGDDRQAGAIRTGETPEMILAMRVYAKVTYKGRPWFVVAETHDLVRCRITSLLLEPPVWVDCKDCVLVRRYQPHMVGHGRFGRMVHQTVGNLKAFAEKQAKLRSDEAPRCAACGNRSLDLVEDLEDGLMKCHRCCDIPG